MPKLWAANRTCRASHRRPQPGSGLVVDSVAPASKMDDSFALADFQIKLGQRVPVPGWRDRLSGALQPSLSLHDLHPCSSTLLQRFEVCRTKWSGPEVRSNCRKRSAFLVCPLLLLMTLKTLVSTVSTSQNRGLKACL